MRIDSAWTALSAKLAGTHQYAGWGEGQRPQVSVSCLLATLPLEQLSLDGLPLFDTALVLPAAPGCSASARTAVGTLDMNLGPRLPEEELCGTRPPDAEGAARRCYLSNVSVLPAAQRRGVGAALLSAAAASAEVLGASILYVHVEEGNAAASALYEAAGFQVEAVEDQATSAALRRPRRRLLSRPVVDGSTQRPHAGKGG